MIRPDLGRALAGASDDAAERVLARAFWRADAAGSSRASAIVVPLVRPNPRPGT